MTRHLGIAEALREAIGEEMDRDPRVFCLGEDIAVPGGWGGAFTVTLGTGAAVSRPDDQHADRRTRLLRRRLRRGHDGHAADRGRPVRRLPAAGVRPDRQQHRQDAVHVGRADPRAAGHAHPVGATGRGSQHAQNVERYFVGVPGLKVVAVSTAYDAKGILKAAVRDDNPVMIFEHKLLYGSKGVRAESGAVDATSEIPDEDYTVPLDTAAVCRPGTDVTILAWLLMRHFALDAARQLAAEGINAEVIDVRSLSPLDYDTIGASVRKTGRVVIVEEGPKTGSISAEIAAGILERYGEYLRCPIQRVASADVPVPFTPVLENAYRPDVPRIVQAVREVMQF